jgi:hypothetical protein
MTTGSEARAIQQGSGRRTAGITCIAGATTMLVGTALWVVSGTDLDAALEAGRIGTYLTDAAANKTILTANLGFWILGVILLGIGGNMLSTLGRADSLATVIARFAFTAGPAAAIVFFSIWLGIVLGLAPAHAAGEEVQATALALGYGVSIADWIATVVIVSLGPLAVAVAGRGTWVPQWLFRWSQLAGALGVVAMVGLITGAVAMAFPVIPVGIGFMIASGVSLLRHP